MQNYVILLISIQFASSSSTSTSTSSLLLVVHADYHCLSLHVKLKIDLQLNWKFVCSAQFSLSHFYLHYCFFSPIAFRNVNLCIRFLKYFLACGLFDLLAWTGAGAVSAACSRPMRITNPIRNAVQAHSWWNFLISF